MSEEEYEGLTIDTDEYERILKDDDGRNNVFALDLLAEVKRLRGLLVEAAYCIHEMEGMAYADADPQAFAKIAVEFRGNVSGTIGADAPWGGEE